jgi:myo-inositol-1(or 4)-monophosphatase
MTDPIDARHALALDLARQGGALALDYFHRREVLVIDEKANAQDMASQADREVEALIRQGIAAAFPGDAILGEEDGHATGTTGFTWVIDPIDGTAPYLAGLPHWCVVIALVQGDRTVAGVIHVPLAAETFSTRRGAGVTLNGAPLTARDDLLLNNSQTAVGASHRTPPEVITGMILRLLQAGGIFYRNGSGAAMLADVAAGRLGGYYEPHMNSWDCLAGLLMVQEAGGRIALFPDLLAGGKVLAAAPGVYEPLAALVD